jgi:hypothetical protein
LYDEVVSRRHIFNGVDITHNGMCLSYSAIPEHLARWRATGEDPGFVRFWTERGYNGDTQTYHFKRDDYVRREIVIQWNRNWDDDPVTHDYMENGELVAKPGPYVAKAYRYILDLPRKGDDDDMPPKRQRLERLETDDGTVECDAHEWGDYRIPKHWVIFIYLESHYTEAGLLDVEYEDYTVRIDKQYVISEYFLKTQHNFKSASHALIGFLEDAACVEVGDYAVENRFICTSKDFQTKYNAYCALNNFKKPAWNKDHYKQTFESYGITQAHGEFVIEGARRTNTFIIGVRLVQDVEDDY